MTSIENLEARLAALEKVWVTGTVPEELHDHEDRVERIVDTLVANYPLDFVDANALRLGVRKALNLFYSGPYAPVDERLKTMQSMIDRIEHDLRVTLTDKARIEREYQALHDQFETAQARLTNVRLAIDGVEEQWVPT